MEKEKAVLVLLLFIISINVMGCTSTEERREEFIEKINDISDENYSALVEEVYKEEATEGSESEDKDISQRENSIRTQEEMWSIMHRMANTKITADEIWGRAEITAELVNDLIIEVYESDYDDKLKLLNILDNWRNEYFDNVVDEHNYVWSKLEGEIGWATGKKVEVDDK